MVYFLNSFAAQNIRFTKNLAYGKTLIFSFEANKLWSIFQFQNDSFAG